MNFKIIANGRIFWKYRIAAVFLWLSFRQKDMKKLLKKTFECQLYSLETKILLYLLSRAARILISFSIYSCQVVTIHFPVTTGHTYLLKITWECFLFLFLSVSVFWHFLVIRLSNPIPILLCTTVNHIFIWLVKKLFCRYF